MLLIRNLLCTQHLLCTRGFSVGSMLLTHFTEYSPKALVLEDTAQRKGEGLENVGSGIRVLATRNLTLNETVGPQIFLFVIIPAVR